MHRVEKATSILSEIRNDNSNAWSIIQDISVHADEKQKKQKKCPAITKYFHQMKGHSAASTLVLSIIFAAAAHSPAFSNFLDWMDVIEHFGISVSGL